MTAVNGVHSPAPRQQDRQTREDIILIRTQDGVDLLPLKNTPPGITNPQTVPQSVIEAVKEAYGVGKVWVSFVKLLL
jgi:hypothetical protein